MNTDLELINFKIPSHTKRVFQETCKKRNQQMTSVLNQYIHDFISENRTPEDDYPIAFVADVWLWSVTNDFPEDEENGCSDIPEDRVI